MIQLPGVGAKGATALLAAVGEDPGLLKNGRGLAAWLGLVPRQHSTGGKDRLLVISKRGDVYRRQLLIHSARSVLRVAERKDDPLSRWATFPTVPAQANLKQTLARLLPGQFSFCEWYQEPGSSDDQIIQSVITQGRSRTP